MSPFISPFQEEQLRRNRLGLPSPIVAPQDDIQNQVQQPNFQRIPITPVAPLPAEQAVSQEQPIDPRDPQYKSGRLRTILAAIAGGLSGAAAGPKVGMEVGARLSRPKYYSALEAQENRLNVLKPKVSIEENRRKAGEEEVKAGVQRGTAQSLAEQRQSKTSLEERKLTETEKTGEARRKHLEQLGKYTEWKQLPENQKKDDLQYLLSLDEGDQQDALKMIKNVAESKQKPLKTEAELAQEEEIAKRKESGRISAGGTPEAVRVAEKKAEATRTGTQTAEAQLATPEVTANYKDLQDKDPASAAAFIKELPAAARTKLATQAGIPATLPVQTQQRLISSRVTLGHVKEALRMATDPDISTNLGPIAGRIEIIKGKVGTGEPDHIKYDDAISQLKPDIQEKMGKFLNFLNYMIINEATTFSASRPSRQLLEQLRETGGRASMSPDRLIGALNGVRDAIKITANQIHKGYGDTIDKETFSEESKPKIDVSKIKIIKQ